MNVKKYDLIDFEVTGSSSIESGFYIIPQKVIETKPIVQQEVYFNKYTPNSAEKNFENWESVYNYREKIGDSPLLAAREKYLFARADVSERGIIGFIGELIEQPIYQGLKVILPSRWLEQGARPMSPASFEQLSQGLQGALDGFKDWVDSKYKNIHSPSDGKNDRHNLNENRDIKNFNDRASEPRTSSQSFDYNDVPVIYNGGGGGGGGGGSSRDQRPTAIV